MLVKHDKVRKLKPGTYFVVSDLQMPLHNRALVRDALAMMDEFSFDGVICPGDEVDLTQLGRWVRGSKGEVEGSLLRDLASARSVMHAFAEKAPLHVVRSNHTDRENKYIVSQAPALAEFVTPKARLLGFPDMSYPSLMGYTDHDNIFWYDRPALIAENLTLCHGDEGGVRMSPGETAAGLVQRWRTGVLCGHCHRMAVKAIPNGYNSKVGIDWAIESGHMMDLSKADFMAPAHAPSWTSGAMILHIGTKHHLPTAVPAVNNRLDRRVMSVVA